MSGELFRVESATRGESASLVGRLVAPCSKESSCFDGTARRHYLSRPGCSMSWSYRRSLPTALDRRMYLESRRWDLRWYSSCLLYTSDAADEEDSVDLGGR